MGTYIKIKNQGRNVSFDNVASNNITSENITSSVISSTTGSFTGLLQGTSSFSITSSYSLTSSYSPNYVLNSATSSFITTSQTSSFSSGSFTGSFTGSLYGTSSWATNAQSSSYLNTLNQDLTINGTASVNYLKVNYIESASIIYSSGSNQFGDATNDTQTLIGRVIVSGSLETTGSANIPNLTGSLMGTASWAESASYSISAGNTNTININSFGSDVSSYLLMSNVLATSGVAIGGDSDLTYNTSTNRLTAVNISATTLTGSLQGTSSWATNALTSSYITTAQTASYVLNAQTASYVVTALTASYVTSSNVIGIVTSASYALTSSYINTLNQNVVITPPSTPGSGVGLIISGSGTKGGNDYLDFLQITNTSASIANPNKYFRLNNSGDIEILRSDYNTLILSLTNGGILRVGGDNIAATSNNDPTTNYISLGSNNTVIYDDGNTHIHSRSSGQSMWINTNGGQLNLLTQSPINGGVSGSGVSIGGGGTLTGYVTINHGKSYTTAANYGYLTTAGAGTYPGGSQTVVLSLYATDRIWGQEIDAFSDERMKDIHGEITLEDGLKLVKTLKPIKYTWKDNSDKGLKVGYSAQQVSKAGFDHLISLIPKEGLEETTDDDGFVSPKDTQFSMNYDQVTPYHGVVIKYLLDKIEQLEREIQSLKK